MRILRPAAGQSLQDLRPIPAQDHAPPPLPGGVAAPPRNAEADAVAGPEVAERSGRPFGRVLRHCRVQRASDRVRERRRVGARPGERDPVVGGVAQEVRRHAPDRGVAVACRRDLPPFPGDRPGPPPRSRRPPRVRRRFPQAGPWSRAGPQAPSRRHGRRARGTRRRQAAAFGKCRGPPPRPHRSPPPGQAPRRPGTRRGRARRRI